MMLYLRQLLYTEELWYELAYMFLMVLMFPYDSNLSSLLKQQNLVENPAYIVDLYLVTRN